MIGGVKIRRRGLNLGEIQRRRIVGQSIDLRLEPHARGIERRPGGRNNGQCERAREAQQRMRGRRCKIGQRLIIMSEPQVGAGEIAANRGILCLPLESLSEVRHGFGGSTKPLQGVSQIVARLDIVRRGGEDRFEMRNRVGRASEVYEAGREVDAGLQESGRERQGARIEFRRAPQFAFAMKRKARRKQFLSRHIPCRLCAPHATIGDGTCPMVDLIRLCDVAEPVAGEAALLARGGNKTLALSPPSSFQCRPPQGSAEDVSRFAAAPAPPPYTDVHSTGSAFVAALEDVMLVTPHAFLASADGKLIADGYHNETFVRIPFKEGAALYDRLLADRRTHRRVSEPALAMIGPWSWIYHHWLFELLPRLAARERLAGLAELPIVVPADLSAVRAETLRRLGIRQDRLLPFDGGVWRFDRLYVPSYPAPGGYARAPLVWLREKFGAVGRPSRRIFVSRADASARRIINEEDVCRLLGARGFASVVPGRLAFADQVATFAEAEIIVGAAGAGLANVVFAPEGALLIELQPASYINRAHWFVANALAQRYAVVLGGEGDERQDYSVDLDKLEQALESLGI